MKIQTLLLFAALFAVSIFSFCKNDAAASKNDTAGTQTAPTEAGATDAGSPGTGAPTFENPLDPAGTATATTPPKPTEPPQNAQGVWHYTCPKGCAGGGGAIAPCTKCGTPLAHNASYHGQPNPTAASPATAPASAPGQTPGQTPPPVTKPPEPAQNAAGVWHYTCTAGCSGGAGTAAACATCGKKLEHNQAYHSK